MPKYDFRYKPPAPVITKVMVIHPTSGVTCIEEGKLDTGADITVIPQRMISELNLSPKGRTWTRSYDGTYSHRLVYYVKMKIENINLPILRCVTSDRENILLGRNVLNRFFITLDGKNLHFEIKDP